MSELYLKLLSAVRQSAYYTEDPREACLFLLTLDTTDRDKISAHFVQNLPGHLRNLDPDLWDGGRNHIILVLYPGTYPNYTLTDLEMDIGKAILAKASFLKQHLRPGFDVPFPLIHDELPLREYNDFPRPPNNPENLLLTFKGKRYVYGGGSETRNSLYHLHNERDVLLLTTCRHGKDWESFMDQRCTIDNQRYDAWDYEELMQNASFCLVPRGRRPDSFRFLEALRSPCVPVVLSDDLELPFDEVLDWDQAVLRVPEYRILTLPERLRDIPIRDVLALRRRGQRLYEHYFSSVERIIFTLFEVMRERIGRWGRRGRKVWSGDELVGALYRLSHLRPPFPDARPLRLTIQMATRAAAMSTLQAWARPLLTLPYIAKVVILWQRKEMPPNFHSVRSQFDRRLDVLHNFKSQTSRIQRLDDFSSSNAVLFLDDQHLLNVKEVEGLVGAWSENRGRLVGLEPRAHIWDVAEGRWTYTSKRLPAYSLLLDSALLVHRYWLELMEVRLAPGVQRLLSEAPECGDLALNLLVAEASRIGPLRPTLPIEQEQEPRRLDPWPALFRTRQDCMSVLSGLFGERLPLKWTPFEAVQGSYPDNLEEDSES